MLRTGVDAVDERVHFTVDRASSALLVEARSNVGLVSFGTTEIIGEVAAFTSGDELDTGRDCLARLTIPLESLTSGNSLYDAELQQRMAVRRYPEVVVELVSAEPLEGGDHSVSGRVTIHGVTTLLYGEVRISRPDPDTVLVHGESVIDIRDFDIPLPSVLMLRIYPDVKVSLQLVATRVPPPAAQS